MIEDQRHAERIGCYPTRLEAVAKLACLAAVRWDAEPNRAPCESWKTCGREYEIVEYVDASERWQEIGRERRLEVSVSGVRWLE